MNKKLLAVAVAGALGAPLAAFAQSSVTISGVIFMTVDNVKFSNAAATRGNTSESRLNDESSSIVFNIREDLGGGMSAIARVDVKPNPDSSAIAASGDSWIGLSTRSAGRFTAGRHGYHFKTPDDGYGLSVGLKTHPSSIIEFAGGGTVAMLNATRTANSLQWSSPNWGGFTIDAGYMFNPGGSASSEADLVAGNTARKGRAWLLNPTFTGANWRIAYLHWNGKDDAPGFARGTSTAITTSAQQLTQSDQRKDSLYGFYTWGGFKIGALWDRSRLTAATTLGAVGAGTRLSNRTAWSIPIRYTEGNHNFLAHYTKARDDKATAVQDGAKLWALTYAYTLSKRTSASLTYGKLNNDAGGVYSGYTTAGGLGSVNAGSGPGEDSRYISFGTRHNF